MAEADRRGGHAVLHIDPAWNANPDVPDHASRVNQIEDVMPCLVRSRIGGMVVGVRVVVAVVQDSGVCVLGGDVQPKFHDQGAAYLRGECLERLPVLLKSSVDVQMVSVHGCDRGDRRVQLEEGAVKLVSLRHDGRRVACQKVGVVILGDSSKKSRAAFAAFREDVRHECACGGLPVRPGHGKACLPFGKLAEHAGSLDQCVTVFLDVHQFLQIRRDGRRIDDQSRGHIFRDVVRIIIVMHVNPFFLKGVSQVRGCPVVARYRIPFEFVVPCDGAHADATDTYEINL